MARAPPEGMLRWPTMTSRQIAPDESRDGTDLSCTGYWESLAPGTSKQAMGIHPGFILRAMRIYPGFILSLRASRIIYPGSAEAQDNISLAIYPDNFFQDILLRGSGHESLFFQTWPYCPIFITIALQALHGWYQP